MYRVRRRRMPTAVGESITAGRVCSSSRARSLDRYSSASSARIQSWLHCAVPKLRCAPKPSHSCLITRAPWASAISQVPSLLPQSMMIFSAANGTLSRQRAMTSASLSVNTNRVSGSRDVRVPRARGGCQPAMVTAVSVEAFDDGRKRAEGLLELVQVGPVERTHGLLDLGAGDAARARQVDHFAQRFEF